MKNTRTLKRLAILLMAALLLALWGCKGGGESSESSGGAQKPGESQQAEKAEKPVVTVCMDLDVGSEGQSSQLLRDLVREYDPEFKDSYKLEIEAVPGIGGERESALDRIRVEVMAGKGPDLFLCRSPRAANPNLMPPREREVGLFQYPKALMKRHMFLPLDGYIENAKYMEWDKLYPQIMAAGKNDEGQLILPIGWSMNFVRFDAQSYTPAGELPMTFDEMLKSQDPGIITAVCFSGLAESLGPVADYENDVPAFTKEELTAHLDALIESDSRRTPELEESLGDYAPVTFNRMNASNFTQYDPDSVLLPHCNRDGGATAYITTFGAVNINSEAPEGAFEILELLLSKEAQQDSELLSWNAGAPVHMELLKSKEKINAPFNRGNMYVKSWGLTDYNYDQLQSLIKQINAVDFVTPVHHELSELYSPYDSSPYTQAETKEEREKLVEETYRNIEMMLAEA